ncbi:MAG: transporter [Nibricoccus sp.]
MRCFLLTFTLLVVANFLRAQGSPPFFTDDTATVSKRQWELDLGFSTDRSRTGDHSWTAPSVDLAFGLTDALELDYGTSWLGLHPVDEASRSGLGNSVAGVKWRFFEDEASGFSLAVSPHAEFNNRASSHRRGLVEKGTEFVLPFQVAKTFGDITTALNVGRSFHSRDRRESDGWLAGIAAGRKISENLCAGFEVYGETSRRFDRGWMVFNMGAYYQVNDWLSFSASAGRGFAGADRPDYVAFLGVQLLR